MGCAAVKIQSSGYYSPPASRFNGVVLWSGLSSHHLGYFLGCFERKALKSKSLWSGFEHKLFNHGRSSTYLCSLQGIKAFSSLEVAFVQYSWDF